MEGTMSKVEAAFLTIAIGASLVFMVAVLLVDWWSWDSRRSTGAQTLLDSEEEIDAARHWRA